MKKIRKTFLIISSLLILLLPFTIILNSKNETQANPIAKVGTKTVQKVAKKQIFFYVDKRTVELRNEFLKRQAINELKEGIRKRPGYKTIRMNGRHGSRPIHKNRNQHYQIKEHLTARDEQKLQKSIDKMIEQKMTGGRSWTLLENVADFLIGYKFWVTLPTTIPLLLSGDAAEEIENLAIDAMFDAGLLVPASPSPNENNYNNNDYYHHSGSTWNPSSDETFEEWANNLDTPIIKPIDWDITIDTEKIIYLNNPKSYHNTKIIVDGFSNIEVDNNDTVLGISLGSEDEDFPDYPHIISYFTLYNYGYDGDYSTYLMRSQNFPGEHGGDIEGQFYKNGILLTDKDYDTNYNFDAPLQEIYNPIDLNELEKIEFTFTNVDGETIVKLYFKNDIYEYYFDGAITDLPEELQFIRLGILGLVYNPSETSIDEIYDNLKVTVINTEEIETITLPRPYTYDVDTEVPEIIHLPGPQYFPITDDKGNELEITENEEGEPIVIEKETGQPVPDNTPIEIQNPTQPLPEPDPNAPPLNTTPIETPTPTQPNYPDPNYPPIGDPVDPETPGDGGIIPPFPEGETCGEIDLDIKSIDLFTEKFPFSLPFDVYNAIQALFGKMGENPPEFTYKIADTEIEIKIPDFILDSQKFIRSIILFIFDVSMIYALYRLFGGAS